MSRHGTRLAALAATVFLVLPAGLRAQEPPEEPISTPDAPAPAEPATPEAAPEAAVLTEEDEWAKRLGFYFGITLDRMSQLGQANGIGVVTDPPPAGSSVMPVGPEIDGDFKGRFNLGFQLGFRLRKNHGRVEANYLQWDEKQDLLTLPPDGKVIANALASPDAGFLENFDPPTGPPSPADVSGIEAFNESEGSEGPDVVLDGAEDWNFNALPDFIRFDTSNRLVGELSTDYQVFDVDYVRSLKKTRRFTLDGRVGLRVASLSQETDLAYRQVDFFAVYNDEESCPQGNLPNCSERSMRDNDPVMDGDGDGERSQMQNEADGDGFMDGDGDQSIDDSLDEVETVSEDRIVALIDTDGFGLKLGLDGRYDLSRKWSLRGGFAVSLLSTDVEFRYRETFTSERDRYLNFIDWDFNGDGHYNNLDLDFDGSCQGRLEDCKPDVRDQAAIGTQLDNISRRLGLECAIVGTCWPPPNNRPPAGMNQDGSFMGVNGRKLRVDDPIPESERGNDLLRETVLLADEAGSSSGVLPIVDVHLGVHFQFSKFATVSFGLKSTRWFDAGTFRSIASDVVAKRDVEVGGDFSSYGYFLTLTVVPR